MISQFGSVRTGCDREDRSWTSSCRRTGFDIRDRLRAIREGNAQPFVFRIQSPSGRLFWVRVSSRPNIENGQCIGIRGILTDVTALKVTEESLKASEGHYRGIFENAPMGIFHSAPEGTLIDANRTFAQIFGYDSPGDILETVNREGGTPILYEDPEKRADFIRQVSDVRGMAEL